MRHFATRNSPVLLLAHKFVCCAYCY